MKVRLPETALNECITELRAATRLPIDEAAIDMVMDWVRPNFERILGHPDGPKRWADHGQRMRDNGRHMGGFADFFASHSGTERIGVEEMKRAFQVIRADCTVRAERTPVAYEFCPKAPVNVRAAQEFLRAIAPVPELMRQAV